MENYFIIHMSFLESISSITNGVNQLIKLFLHNQNVLSSNVEKELVFKIDEICIIFHLFLLLFLSFSSTLLYFSSTKHF